MTPAEVAAKLRVFNEWRRGDYEPSEQPAPPDPREISEAIDAAVEMIERSERLETALRDVAQTLAWIQHGECRGFSEGAILTTNEALDAARAALEKSK